MSKNVISQSDELIRLRKSYRNRNLIESIFIGLGVVLIWLIYVFLVASATGYQNFNFAPLGQWTAFSGLPYPDLHGNFWNLGDANSLARFLIAICVVAVAVASGLVYHFIHNKMLSKIYSEKYTKLLVEEAKINGISLASNIVEKDSEDDAKKVVELLSISEPKRIKMYQISTPMFSWNGVQCKYDRDGKSRDAFMITANLTKTRTHGFVQLRTFGEPSIKQYDGLPVRKYGFGDILKLASFICYTSLGQDIYLIIDKKVANALSAFYQFVRCDIIVMIIGDKLTIFIDGFELNLIHPLDEKVPYHILETEAEALVALHQSISAIEEAFSGEVSFAQEEKGNGIISY